jgi:hypothetical protein
MNDNQRPNVQNLRLCMTGGVLSHVSKVLKKKLNIKTGNIEVYT